LRKDAPLEIRSDLHVLAAADGAELFHARHLRHEPDATCAMDAAVHESADQRPDVLLFHRSFVFLEARAARAIDERLILQIALTALVANRAVKRVVDEQELQDPLARLLDHWRVGLDLLWAAVLVR